MALYPIVHKLTRPDGSLDRAAIRAKARELAARETFLPLPATDPTFRLYEVHRPAFAAVLKDVLRTAIVERDENARRAALNAEWDAKEDAQEREAHRLAKFFGYNRDAILFQISRRSAGSFATTNARHELPIYRRALAICGEREVA